MGGWHYFSAERISVGKKPVWGAVCSLDGRWGGWPAGAGRGLLAFASAAKVAGRREEMRSRASTRSSSARTNSPEGAVQVVEQAPRKRPRQQQQRRGGAKKVDRHAALEEHVRQRRDKRERNR